MPDVRHAALIAISITVLAGTSYSVLNNTYLDTSNPLLTHLPHPLSNTHYYANKSNFLNVYFIKKAWAWTSAVFLFSWFTSPPNTRTMRRMLKWAVETGVWLMFTNWFFGPALLERVVLASGGECLVASPSGEVVTVPTEYCLSKSYISPSSHPTLFSTFSPNSLPRDWNAIPRLRKGHDVSGHIFLLTMSVLFLADQLRYSAHSKKRSTWNNAAICANVFLIVVWLFATWTTSLYFHSPSEKVTGYLLGISGFTLTQLIN
ncbi:Fat storage-inducing transmembrane protein [Collybia nuda]|uniref:Fat storage-inducing transmembrane protein n=1 Tax=Collybia nuda TaxID=64659 RepID=A0A9P6CRU8_9AGAR|nr:Fat storage-inducing transmembrane protein [Collybia nuda]